MATLATAGTRPPPAGSPPARPGPAGRPLDSTALRLLDAALVLGAAARLTRLVVLDDAGEPIRSTLRCAASHARGGDLLVIVDDGLRCPYCVAVWVSAGVVGSYAAWGQRGWWQTVAGALATSYAAGHAVARLDEE